MHIAGTMCVFRAFFCLFVVATKASTVPRIHPQKHANNHTQRTPNTRRSHPLHAVVFLVDDLGYGDTHHRSG